MSSTLAKITKAKAALIAAKTLDDVLEIRDQAEAVRVYVKAAKEGQLAANAAAEIKLSAERKAGKLLAAREKPKPGPKKLGDTMSPNSLGDLGVSKKQSSRWQQEAAISEETFQQYVDESNKNETEITQAGLLKLSGRCHVANNSGENEWYTPQQYVEAAATAMGGIDLDPASCEKAQANVRAGTFYTADDNGLEKRWFGRVWLNPPYSKDLIGAFAEKVATETYEQACVLVNNATDARWFHRMTEAASAICFIKGRIKFLDLTGNPAKTPLQGQAVIYVGSRVAEFRNSFSPLGLVVTPCNTPSTQEASHVG